MNKKEALVKVNKLNEELAKLKAIIEAPEDIFQVTTYSDVCKKLNEDELDLSYFKNLPEYMRLKCLNYAKIKQLERFFNEGWEPNWSNSIESKYYLWFEYKNGGWVFRGSSCLCYVSSGQVGFYKNSIICNHIAKYFKDIYINILN